MKLDPQRCPVGTVGFIQPGTVFEFMNSDDFDWFKKPSVVLGEDRKWHSIEKDDNGESLTLRPETPVFADWKSALIETVRRERTDAEKEIEEAQKTIAQANAVEQWLYQAE